MKKISIVTPCYNEEENVREVYRQVKEAIPPGYAYEHLFIDNCSRRPHAGAPARARRAGPETSRSS